MHFLRKIRVLSKYEPYLSLLNAYNGNNFCHNNWRSLLLGGVYALATTLTYVSQCALVMLSIWNFAEDDANFDKIFSDFPILISLLQMALTFIALVIKSHTITATINRLQLVVNQSEFVVIRQFYPPECQTIFHINQGSQFDSIQDALVGMNRGEFMIASSKLMRQLPIV